MIWKIGKAEGIRITWSIHIAQCTCMKMAIHCTESWVINLYYIIQIKNQKETKNTYWTGLSSGLLIFFEI